MSLLLLLSHAFATPLTPPGSDPAITFWEGDNSGDHAGRTIRVAELTGDGIDDVVIAVPAWDDPKDSGAPGTEEQAGQVLVFSAPTPGTFGLGDAVAAFTGDAGIRLGEDVAVADFNGDGWQDVAAGATRWPHDGSYRGAVYVWLGAAPDGHAGTRDVSDADLVIEGVTTDGVLGWALSAMDLDEDGYDDLVVGEPGRLATSPGAVRVFLGDASFSGTLLATDADHAAAGSGDERYGYSLCTLNLAPWPSIFVGAPGDDRGGTDAGAVITWRLYADPYGSPVLMHETAVGWGEAAGDLLGASVACVPDQWVYGTPDAVAGAPGWGANDEGRVYVGNGGLGFAGGATIDDYGMIFPVGTEAGGRCGSGLGDAGDFDGDGLSDYAVWCQGTDGWDRVYVIGDFWGHVAASPLDVLADVVVDGLDADVRLGQALAGIGDLDGDGAGELLVGASRGVTEAGVDAGVVYALPGVP